MAVADRGGNEIVFGSTVGPFINKSEFGFRGFYHNAAVTNGGRGTVAYFVSHEFGHTMDNNKYSRQQLVRGRPEPFANLFAKSLFLNFTKSGIDMSDVRVR